MKLRWLGTILLCAACGSGEAQPNLDVGALPAQAEDAARPERGGTFAWGRSGDASHLDPAVVTDGESVQVVTNLFDTLVTFKKGEAEIVPWLAERWEVSEDGLVWTFTLREGVRFHDGTPLDAEAVKFTFDRFMDPETSNPSLAAIGPLTSTEVVDERTVTMSFESPFGPFLSFLTDPFSGIISPTAVEAAGDDFSNQPVGSGPFKVVEHQPGDEVLGFGLPALEAPGDDVAVEGLGRQHVRRPG